jgi:serine/threonine-protein kinase
MTDEPPFSDPDPEAHLFEQVMSRRRPTPASKGRDVGPFEPIIAKALSLSPRDRWRNAGELLAALEDAAAGRAASPATAIEAGADLSGGDLGGARRPGRLGRAAALAVVAVMFLVAGGWVLLGRREPPRSGSPAAERAPARAPATVVESAPATPAAPAPPVVAAAPPPTPPAPALRTGFRKGKGNGKAKTRGVEAPARVDVGDGRALFDDTK